MKRLVKKTFVCTGVILLCIWIGNTYGASGGSKAETTSASRAKGKQQDIQKGAKAKDPERVVMQLGNKKLKGWQVDEMMKIGAGPDEASVCDVWVKLQLEAAEARKRGLDKTEKARFVIALLRDNYLRGQLEQSIVETLPKATEEQAKKEYETNKQKYTRPLRATVQHITMQERNRAEDVVKMAGQKGADFSELVKKYSTAADKSRKGEMKNAFESQLIRNLGNETYKAIAKAKKGQVLGPFVGRKGFEIVKVISITPSAPYPFSQIKRSILARLDGSARQESIKKLVDNLKTKVKVVKSKELLDAEKKAQQQKTRMFGPR